MDSQNPITKSFAFIRKRTIALDVVQGILIGAGLAFITVLVILPNVYVTKVNGWTTMFGCGEPGNTILFRAACAVVFAGPINVPQEAMYWTTKIDGTGQQLTGAHDYTLHFTGPAWKGQVPSGMTQIVSPDNSALVLGRVLVYRDNDLPIAYGLSKQIQLTPLNR